MNLHLALSWLGHGLLHVKWAASNLGILGVHGGYQYNSWEAPLAPANTLHDRGRVKPRQRVWQRLVDMTRPAVCVYDSRLPVSGSNERIRAHNIHSVLGTPRVYCVGQYKMMEQISVL